MAEFKFFCPQCGRQIQCDISYSGTQINCPVCRQAITVPQATPEAGSVLPPPMVVKSGKSRNILFIAVAALVLAGLVLGGWFGYSRIKIRKLPPGLVALWSAEDGSDSVGDNKAKFTDISFVKGKVGQGFVFNGSSSQARIPASPSLNVGLGNGFTIEEWINPANLNLQIICEWNKNNRRAYGASQVGVNMGISAAGVGAVNGNIVDTSGGEHNVITANNLIVPNQFQHIALTYDKASGVAAFYWNGSLVASTNVGTITPQTSYDFFMGNRPSGAFTGIHYQGEMDKPAIYNRALTAEEIQAIYREQK